MSSSPSDNSTVSAFLSTLSLEEHSHLTPDLGMVPIHNTFPINLTHAALLQNYPLISPCLDKWHQMEQYFIFDINTGLSEYQPQKTQRYWFHPYTSLMSALSSRQTPSCLVKLNNNSHKPHSDIRTEHHRQPFNLSTMWSPSFSQPFNGEFRHKGNPTHVANSNEIRCGIHEEDGHYIVNCTNEQYFDNQWGQHSIIGGWRTRNEEWRCATVKVLTMPIVHQVWDPWRIDGGIVMILLLTFPHSFSSHTLYMLLPPAYYFLFTFLFPSTDFHSFHVLPYCFYIASCTVCLLMQSCIVCLLMHSLLRHSLITQYIMTG